MDDIAARADWLDLISPHIHNTGHLSFEKGVINPLRVINDHELFMFSSGTSKLVFGGREYPCPANSFLIIPPGREHVSYAVSKEIHIHWTHFDWEFRSDQALPPHMPRRGRESPPRRSRRSPHYVPDTVLNGRIESPAYVFDLHRRLCAQWDAGGQRRQRSVRGLLLAILHELLEPPGDDRSRSARAVILAERVRARLTALANQPFCEMASIKRSLRELGGSYFHQERLFRKCYGVSPSQYVSALRIERIKEALRDSDAPLAEIAGALGFGDYGYFSRLFSKHAGCSPREFRNRMM